MLTGSFFHAAGFMIGYFPAAARPLIAFTCFRADSTSQGQDQRPRRSRDEKLSIRAFDALVRWPPKTRADGAGPQPLRELDRVPGLPLAGPTGTV